MRITGLILSAALLLLLLPVGVCAMDYTAPPLEGAGEAYMPEETESLAEGLWSILQDAVALLQPAIADAAGTCLCIVGSVILLSLTHKLPGNSEQVSSLIGTLVIALLLFQGTNTLIHGAVETVNQISDYGMLLLPVMTGALAAQGAAGTSAALYAGTAAFNSILSGAISGLLTPMVYIYLVLCIAKCATGEEALGKLRDLVKWALSWGLKIALYIFTGYMGITRVVSGSVDAAAVKATKLTISGMVPVVGGILSDASESILVSAGIMKNAAGIYGLLAIAAIWVEPFIRIGVQYLLLKVTASVCGVFGEKKTVELIGNFSTAMGLLLAMTGAVCLMLLISVICFMKGVS